MDKLYTRQTTPTGRVFVASMARWQVIAKRITATDRRLGAEVARRLEGHPPRDPAIELAFDAKQAAVIMAADASG